LTISENLQEHIRASVGRHDAAVVGLTCRGEAKAPVFEVFIDNEHGITLDLCREVSRDLQTLIDRELPGARYRLVVSSPGLERPLQHSWQYRKHTGRILDFMLSGQERGKFTGRLLSVSEQGIVVQPLAGDEHRSFGFDEILSATVRPPW
jgi:ribosome maturation factor RimP